MQLNALHMRFGAIAGGVLLMAGYALFGGSFGTEPIVQIEFGMDPDYFAGLAVEIDGRVVGHLEQIGGATRSGFEVRRGTHKVRVIDPQMASTPTEVTLDKPGAKARLMLDVVEMWDERTGTSKATLVLQ